MRSAQGTGDEFFIFRIQTGAVRGMRAAPVFRRGALRLAAPLRSPARCDVGQRIISGERA